MRNPSEEKQFLIDEIINMHLSLIELKLFLQELTSKVDSNIDESLRENETINWIVDSLESKKTLTLNSENIGNSNYAILEVCKILKNK